MNGTLNTLNINSKITQTAIVALHYYQPVDNKIISQVKIPLIGRQRVFNVVATNNDVSVTR